MNDVKYGFNYFSCTCCRDCVWKIGDSWVANVGSGKIMIGFSFLAISLVFVYLLVALFQPEKF